MESEQLQSFQVPGSGYGYTGTPIGNLTSFENTLATGLLDESGSTNSFARQMELGLKEIIKSLRRSPRADNLIYRHCHFGTMFREHHGFKPLAQINENDYDGCYQPGGQTHMYDAIDRVINETLDYARQQSQLRYMCNGVLYVIGDGMDFGSTLRQADAKRALERAVASEELESLLSILIGVNPDPGVQDGLKDLAAKVGFSQYVPIEKADEETLAKLANFISRSIVAQSQHLGSGGPSQPLTF